MFDVGINDGSVGVNTILFLLKMQYGDISSSQLKEDHPPQDLVITDQPSFILMDGGTKKVWQTSMEL